MAWTDRDTQMCIGNDVYTTSDRVCFTVMETNGKFGQRVVEIEPGESKTVILPPNGKAVTIHRPLETAQTEPSRGRE